MSALDGAPTLHRSGRAGSGRAGRHAALALAADQAPFCASRSTRGPGTVASGEDNHRPPPDSSALQPPSAPRWARSDGRLRRNDAAVAATREALGQEDFDAAWAEGAALSTDEAIAYAQRGRGERKRPQRMGVTDPDRERRRPAGSRGVGQQGHRRTAVHLAAHRADPPHARLRQTGPGARGSSSSRRPPVTRDGRAGTSGCCGPTAIRCPGSSTRRCRAATRRPAPGDCATHRRV